MKEEIVQKGTELFLKVGFKSVTMDDISAAMGISKKTIYEYFDNKETLVKCCAEQHFLKIIEVFKKIRTHSENPILELFLIKKEVLKHLSNATTSPQYQLQKFYAAIYNDLKKKEFELMGTMFRQSLQKGISMGLYRADIDLDFITRIYFNGIAGIRNIELFPLEVYRIDALISSFFEYHLRAITTPKGMELFKSLTLK